jgi:Cu(I)/Ag(I) efflux system membrane fusion protein
MTNNTPDKTKRANYHLNYILLIFIAIISCLTGWFFNQYRHKLTFGTDTKVAAGERKILFYQSSMHPWITSDKPGKCTICGMDLAPIYEDEAQSIAHSDFTKLTDTARAIIGVESVSARVTPLVRTLRVAGVLSDDETKRRILSARVSGRIEILHVNQLGIDVTANQPLAVIFSPTLKTAQRRYLEALNNLNAGTEESVNPEIANTRERLLSFGMPEDDIETLERSKKTDAHFVVRSFADGAVVSRNVYEGQYVHADDELFQICDFSMLWFIFDAYENTLPLLKLNQPVTISLPSFSNETFTAPITFIDPSLNETTHTARVRVVIPNPQKRILHRQTANGVVHIETEPTLVVPRSSILYTRNRPVAYVDLGNGAYQLRQIELGQIGDTDIEIVSGIEEGEKVVTQAALLVDGQTQLAHIADTPNSVTETTAQEHLSTITQNSIPDLSSKSSSSVVLPDNLVEIVLKATNALSSDNLAEYQNYLPQLIDAVKIIDDEEVYEFLEPFMKKLVAGGNLKEARQPFELFSDAFAGIIKSQPAGNRQAYIFQCPMSPVLGKARWIQKQNKEVLNPFFGSEMLNCGIEL